VQRTAYARETLAALDGVALAHERPVVREFALRLDAPAQRVRERCFDQGVDPGLAIGDDELLVAITEQRSRADIDRLAEVLGAAVREEQAGRHRPRPVVASPDGERAAGR
jgi:glycine dehydrogenase subunit 1